MSKEKENLVKKIFAVMCVIAVIGSMCVFALADAASASKSSLTTIVSTFASYTCDMFRVVGIIIAIYATAQFALAFKDDNPDSKQRSVILIVIGMLLVFVKNLAQIVIDNSGMTGITLNSGFLN
jgi:hypothetical protein